MLRIKSTIYLTGQANNNDRNSKYQTKKTIAQATQASTLRVEPVWNLEFVILDNKLQGRAIYL
jgi:hypothetical protein